MKKIIKNNITGFIIGVILCSGITVYAAYAYSASQISYKSTNVESALNDLYGKVIDGPTYVAPQTGETHKGIVYLDPTDITKKCTAQDAASNVNNNGTPTEVKTGCMKWYVFKEDNTKKTYTMILDHNTTARVKWNDSNSNVAYPASNVSVVVGKLVIESNWEVAPRLITADEINSVTGKTGFNTSDTNSWYYLDTLTQTKADFTSSRSKYDWLYNYINLCKTDSNDYGCTVEDLNTYIGYGTAGDGQTYGYWTSTSIGTSGYGSNMWYVARGGNFTYSDTINMNLGIRPVITIPKNLVK